jgi:hypothetical protein
MRSVDIVLGWHIRLNVRTMIQIFEDAAVVKKKLTMNDRARTEVRCKYPHPYLQTRPKAEGPTYGYIVVAGSCSDSQPKIVDFALDIIVCCGQRQALWGSGPPLSGQHGIPVE